MQPVLNLPEIERAAKKLGIEMLGAPLHREPFVHLSQGCFGEKVAYYEWLVIEPAVGSHRCFEASFSILRIETLVSPKNELTMLLLCRRSGELRSSSIGDGRYFTSLLMRRILSRAPSGPVEWKNDEGNISDFESFCRSVTCDDIHCKFLWTSGKCWAICTTEKTQRASDQAVDRFGKVAGRSSAYCGVLPGAITVLPESSTGLRSENCIVRTDAISEFVHDVRDFE